MTGGWTYHGGRLAAARAVFGDHPGPWIDLSTGINPDPWREVDSVEIDWQRLPEEGALRDLEAAAANHFGADPANVAALPGTEIGLRLLGDLLTGPAEYRWPSYRTHAEIFASSEPVRGIAPKGSGARHLVLANPNNPDGQQLPAARLLDLLSELHDHGAWLIVDEAFADANPRESLTPHVSDDAPLVVFRSFGKFFGLAGVRLGFVLGPSEIVAACRARLGAWPVSSAAIAIGAAAYRDHEWIAGTRAALAGKAAELDALLSGHGLAAMGQCPLFRLIKTSDAAEAFERLARQAILTRPFDYNPEWLRIGLPRDEDEWARLDRALSRG
ncbi:MAG: threonine-phosphate decarboxylase [Novosphingobium sp.]